MVGLDWLKRIDPPLIESFDKNQNVNVREACEKEVSAVIKSKKLFKRRERVLSALWYLYTFFGIFFGTAIYSNFQKAHYIKSQEGTGTIVVLAGIAVLVTACHAYRRLSAIKEWNLGQIVKQNESVRTNLQNILMNLGAFTHSFFTGTLTWRQEGIFTSKCIEENVAKMQSELERNQKLYYGLLVDSPLLDERMRKEFLETIKAWKQRLSDASWQLPLFDMDAKLAEVLPADRRTYAKEAPPAEGQGSCFVPVVP
ncbi:MAG: hypothetical protein WCO09_01925 [bacterium]